MSPKRWIPTTLKELILGRDDPRFEFPTVIVPKSLSDQWWAQAHHDQETRLHAPTVREGFWIRVWNYVREQRARMVQEMKW